MNAHLPTSGSCPWLHRLAVLTVCAAVPLLFLGAEVTTKKVGMVDPQGMRTPWHLFTVLWEHAQRGEMPSLGFIIEHSHRLAGWLVGLCVILLALGLWLKEKRLWLRLLGLAALVGVGVQGLLGKYRVDLNALMGNNLALVHGCFAQLVFALLVSLALFTSRGWSQPVGASANSAETFRLWRWSAAVTVLVYLQIILGAMVRHSILPFTPRLHQVPHAGWAHAAIALAIVAATALLMKRVLALQPRPRQLLVAALFLGGLVLVQLFLGVQSWLTRQFPVPGIGEVEPLPLVRELLRSLHFFVGSLVFSASLVVTLQAYRQTLPLTHQHAAPVGRWQGAV